MTAPTPCYVQVTRDDGRLWDVGPFSRAGGLGAPDSAVAWIYRQIGLLMTHHPQAELEKERWQYRESGFALLPDSVEVDVRLRIAGVVLEITARGRPDAPLLDPVAGDVVDELIDSRPITENL